MSPLTAEEKKVLPTAVVKKVEAEERAEKKLKDEFDAKQAAAKAAEEAQSTQEPPADPKPVEPVVEPIVEPVEPVIPTPEPGAEPVARKEVKKDTPTAKTIEEQLRTLQDEVSSQPFKTLQGKYNKEVPTLHAQIKELKQELADTKAKANAAPVVPEVRPELSLLSAEEREAVEDEEESLVLKQARGVVSATERKLSERIEALEGQISESSNQRLSAKREAQEAAIMAEVEEKLPGAKLINESAVFTEWLNQTDPNSRTGASYGARGSDALFRGDIRAIEAILREGALAIGLKLEDTVSEDPARVPPIKPGRQGASAPTVQPKETMVTQSEILSFLKAQTTSKGLRHEDGSRWSQKEIDEQTVIYDQAERDGRIVLGK